MSMKEENGIVRNRHRKSERPEDLHIKADDSGVTPTKKSVYGPRKRQKIATIQKALDADPIDAATLRQLAISRGGLINDELRREAWPKLLSIDVEDVTPCPEEVVLLAHRDYNQVVLDVNRSLKRFPPGMEDEERLSLQDILVRVIMRVLVNHPELHYYQGYHDICVTFLLVAGEEITVALVDRLSIKHLRDFMDENMDRTKHTLNYLYPIVGKANPKLRQFMELSDVGTIFCLSWLITWYGHVLSEFRHIVRLYDFFIACHPLMPIYLSAAIVLYRESEIMSSECEMCVIHSLLSKIPEDLPYEQLISKAGDLYLLYPPSEIANEALVAFKKSTEMSQYLKSRQISRQDGFLRGRLRSTFSSLNTNIVIKVTVWTITVAVSAAAFAVLNTAGEWGWFKWT